MGKGKKLLHKTNATSRMCRHIEKASPLRRRCLDLPENETTENPPTTAFYYWGKGKIVGSLKAEGGAETTRETL